MNNTTNISNRLKNQIEFKIAEEKQSKITIEDVENMEQVTKNHSIYGSLNLSELKELLEIINGVDERR